MAISHTPALSGEMDLYCVIQKAFIFSLLGNNLGTSFSRAYGYIYIYILRLLILFFFDRNQKGFNQSSIAIKKKKYQSLINNLCNRCRAWMLRIKTIG